MKALFMKDSLRDAMLGSRPLPSPAPPLASIPAASPPPANAPRRAALKTMPRAPKPEVVPKSGDDAKKRVRLKPETREQLLERLRNPPLSLHETSILLRVSRATVRRYADAGRLPCLRTPGGQRRFALRDIEAFYRQLKSKR